MSFQHLNKNQKHDISAIVDRLKLQKDDDNRSGLSESIDTALNLSDGLVQIEVLDEESEVLLFHQTFHALSAAIQ